MKGWNKTLLFGIALLGLAATADARMAEMGGRSSGGFQGSHSRPFPFHVRQQNFRVVFPPSGFGRVRSGGWGGGAYTAGVGGFDYDEDDYEPEDLHFRVQDTFGPGDIGRPSPPPQPSDDGPWDAARLDP